MIDVANLSKSYGPIEALRDVSFTVAPHEVVGLLGPNGAGKSTAMRILTGYLHADSGDVKIDGLDVVTHTREAREGEEASSLRGGASLGGVPRNSWRRGGALTSATASG